jgi:hypothetical protein
MEFYKAPVELDVTQISVEAAELGVCEIMTVQFLIPTQKWRVAVSSRTGMILRHH